MEHIQDHQQLDLSLLPYPLQTTTTHHDQPVHTLNCNYTSSDTVSLDLQLSISSGPVTASAPSTRHEAFDQIGWYRAGNVESMKRHAEEQIRLAAADKAYAERVRELTRREMEAAEVEFARAKQVWERAHHEMEVAQKMKDKAASRVDPSSCMEITCQSCRLSFCP